VAIALEDLTGIRKLYRKGNGQGVDNRFRLNSWPHLKARWMLEYKVVLVGLTIVPLTKSKTYGSSSDCSACGKKLRSPATDDAEHERMLWCQNCEEWIDREVNAALNLSTRGLARFAISRPWSKSLSSQHKPDSPATVEEGLTCEAMRGTR